MTRTRLFGLLMTIAVTLSMPARVGADNLLLDPRLDSGTAGGAGLPGTNAFWTLTNTGNATAAQYEGGFANQVNLGGLGVWYRAFLGAAGSGVGSTLTQSVTATTAGAYVLRFQAVVEQNFLADALNATLTKTGGASVTLDLLSKRVGAGSTYSGGGFGQIGAATPPYDPRQALSLAGVNAGDTLTVSIEMINGRSSGVNPQSAVIDNFELALIPEPSACVLASSGLLGALVLRRRR